MWVVWRQNFIFRKPTWWLYLWLPNHKFGRLLWNEVHRGRDIPEVRSGSTQPLIGIAPIETIFCGIFNNNVLLSLHLASGLVVQKAAGLICGSLGGGVWGWVWCVISRPCFPQIKRQMSKCRPWQNSCRNVSFAGRARRTCWSPQSGHSRPRKILKRTPPLSFPAFSSRTPRLAVSCLFRAGNRRYLWI